VAVRDGLTRSEPSCLTSLLERPRIRNVGTHCPTKLLACDFPLICSVNGDVAAEVDVLIGVDLHAAVFLEVNKSKPVILFELAKGWLTGERVEPGETHSLREPHR
jgi:hypothetical protein